RLAAGPIAFDIPPPVAHPAILAEWAKAASEVRAVTTQRRVDRRRDRVGASKINSLTWAFIHEGASEGERHRRLFSAAANLAEFAGVEDLISAILTTPGIDSGLPAREVDRQIRCGIEHVRKNHEGPSS